MSTPAPFVVALERRPEGRAVAMATVRIGLITISYVALLRQAGGWALGLPRRSEAGVWHGVVEIDEPLRGQVLAAVLAAYREQGQ